MFSPNFQGLARAGRDNRSGDHCSEAPGPWETAGFGCVAMFRNDGENISRRIFFKGLSEKNRCFCYLFFFSSLIPFFDGFVDIFFLFPGGGEGSNHDRHR